MGRDRRLLLHIIKIFTTYDFTTDYFIVSRFVLLANRLKQNIKATINYDIVLSVKQISLLGFINFINIG